MNHFGTRVLVWGFDSQRLSGIIQKIEASGLASVPVWIGANKSQSKAYPSAHELNLRPARCLKPALRSSPSYELYQSLLAALPGYIDIYSRHMNIAQQAPSQVIDNFMSSVRLSYDMLVSDSIGVVLFNNIPHEGFDFVLYNLSLIHI